MLIINLLINLTPQGYDSKFIFKELVQNPKVKDIKVIAQSSEKIIAIETRRFRFIDSFAHLLSPLDTLADNLKKHGKEHFLELLREFPEDQKHNLLLGKGKFCHEYVTCSERLNDACPPRSAFYSSLKGSSITEQQYQTVEEIFKTFNLKTVGELMELYCVQDVLITADCVNHYRKMVRESFNLEAMVTVVSAHAAVTATYTATAAAVQCISSRASNCNYCYCYTVIWLSSLLHNRGMLLVRS